MTRGDGARSRDKPPTRDERILQALGVEPPGVPGFGSTTVDRSCSVGQVTYAVLRAQLSACLAQEPGSRLGEDIEALHRMRVAVRRLRAALALFGDWVPRLARFEEDLRWLGRALGEVRDLDVHLAEIGSQSRALDAKRRAVVHVLVVALERRRKAARRRLLRALDSRRYERLVARMSALLRRGPAGRSPATRVSILAAAPQLIAERFGRVVKLGDEIGARSSAESFHKLRIRCKALRYALECHREVYRKDAEPLIRALEELQDVLGKHQDAVVASNSLHEIVRQEGRKLPVETVFVAGVLAERCSRRAATLRCKTLRIYTRLLGSSWKRLRRAMDSSRPASPPAKE